MEGNAKKSLSTIIKEKKEEFGFNFEIKRKRVYRDDLVQVDAGVNLDDNNNKRMKQNPVEDNQNLGKNVMENIPFNEISFDGQGNINQAGDQDKRSSSKKRLSGSFCNNLGMPQDFEYFIKTHKNNLNLKKRKSHLNVAGKAIPKDPLKTELDMGFPRDIYQQFYQDNRDQGTVKFPNVPCHIEQLPSGSIDLESIPKNEHFQAVLTMISEKEAEKFLPFLTTQNFSLTHLINYCKDRFIEESSDLLYNDAIACETHEILQENIYNIYERNKALVLEKALRDFDEWDQELTQLENLIKKDQFLKDETINKSKSGEVISNDEKSVFGKTKYYVPNSEQTKIQEKSKKENSGYVKYMMDMEKYTRENDKFQQYTVKLLGEADGQVDELKKMVHDELIKGEEELYDDPIKLIGDFLLWN